MNQKALAADDRQGGIPAELDQVIRSLADRVGELIKFWGFSPHTGRVWTLLYLTEQPLSAVEIGDELDMSAGLTSQTLNELLRWGVVHRLREPSSKAWRYVEEPDVWRSVTRVLRERERRMVEETVELMDLLLEALKERRGVAPARAEYMATRVAALRALARTALAFLEALVMSGSLDIQPLKQAMRLAQIRRKVPFLR